MTAMEGSHPVLWEPAGVNTLGNGARRRFPKNQTMGLRHEDEKSSPDRGEMEKENTSRRGNCRCKGPVAASSMAYIRDYRGWASW